jgi:hypothetical protein
MMASRILFLSCFILMISTSGFAQASYNGLTPGKSTRAEAERVLGRPLKQVSHTLIEYKPVENMDKVYVQYRDESATAVVERIEFVWNWNGSYDFSRKLLRQAGVPEDSEDEAYVSVPVSGLFKASYYHGSPVFLVVMNIHNGTGYGELSQARVGLYTRELYESALPKGCTGRLWGIWETNRGRLTLTRQVADFKTVGITGAYTTNNGSLRGNYVGGRFIGEWKDDTGSGTLELGPNFKEMKNVTSKLTLIGTWERKTGKGPREGTWEGRCVESP